MNEDLFAGPGGAEAGQVEGGEVADTVGGGWQESQEDGASATSPASTWPASAPPGPANKSSFAPVRTATAGKALPPPTAPASRPCQPQYPCVPVLILILISLGSRAVATLSAQGKSLFYPRQPPLRAQPPRAASPQRPRCPRVRTSPRLPLSTPHSALRTPHFASRALVRKVESASFMRLGSHLLKVEQAELRSFQPYPRRNGGVSRCRNRRRQTWWCSLPPSSHCWHR